MSVYLTVATPALESNAHFWMSQLWMNLDNFCLTDLLVDSHFTLLTHGTC